MSHLLAGVLIFLLGGKMLNIEINSLYLTKGAFWGIAPDIFSYIWQIISGELPKYDKWSHKHRDNFSHSLFLVPLLFGVVWFIVGWQLSCLISLAVLSHIFIDLFGLGWGVKLFYPISRNTYKMFYQRKIVNKYTETEIDELARTEGMDDWIKRIYFTFNPRNISRWWGIVEWLSLVIVLFLIYYF